MPRGGTVAAFSGRKPKLIVDLRQTGANQRVRVDMGETIRILQVFGGLNRGGSETAIMNVYRHIDRSKCQFDFVVHGDQRYEYEDEVRALGGRIYRFPRFQLQGLVSYIRSWRELFRQHPEYRVIHGHFFTISAVYLGVAREFGLSCIAHSHIADVNGVRAFAIRLMTFPVRRIADHHFACSRRAGAWLYGKGILKKQSFHFVPNAIDPAAFAFNLEARIKKRRELGLEGRFALGHVGRFETQKNHAFLLQVFNKLRAINDRAVLVLVGDGQLQKEISDSARSLGIANSVLFTGSRADVQEILQAIDVFVLPSYYEGLPLTLVEAQGAGLPCVVSENVTREVDITDLIERVSLRDPADTWARRIDRYSRGFQRRNRGAEIAKSGFDAKSSAHWLSEFYTTIHLSRDTL